MVESENRLADETIRVAMNGVTGRMGYNQLEVPGPREDDTVKPTR